MWGIYKSLRTRRCVSQHLAHMPPQHVGLSPPFGRAVLVLVDNWASDCIAIVHGNPSATQSIPYFARPPKKSTADLARFVQFIVASTAANVHSRSTSKTAVAFVKRHFGSILSTKSPFTKFQA